MSENAFTGEEAVKKMKDMVDDIKTAMMATGLGNKPLSAIPMTTKKVHDDGKIYFLSGKTSDHNKDIEHDRDVQLLYAKPSDVEFLSIYGKASISTDKNLLESLYSSVSDNWFDGVDDPNLTAIMVEPEEAYYWDTKTNKYISLFKMGVGAIKGEKKDIGEKGKLDI